MFLVHVTITNLMAKTCQQKLAFLYAVSAFVYRYSKSSKTLV